MPIGSDALQLMTGQREEDDDLGDYTRHGWLQNLL